ncbi:MAG: Hsp20/alpha crystallin family protein [Ruminococcus sp.]|nr:Hsp20/alpha crystallin family protein [Ruminococcus sp.]
MFGLTPFGGAYSVFDAMNDFEKSFMKDTRTLPCRTDIREEEGSYIMETELPGYNKEDISIDIDGAVLTLSAKHSETNEEKDAKGKYLRRERTFGSYSRSFDISGVDADSINAEYKNGVLTLTLPKKQKEIPTSRRLQIQ